MEGAPRLKILRHIDAFAIGPRLGVEILDQRSRWRANDTAVLAAENQAANFRPPTAVKRGQQQIFKSEFSFASNYNIGPAIKVLLGIVSGFGPADDYFPTRFACALDY